MTAEPVEKLAAAASAASAQLGETVSSLRERTTPDALLDDVLDLASDKGQQLVRKTRETVSAHPLAVGAAVAAIGLALFTRNTLSNARVDLGDDAAQYTDYDDSYIPAPTPEAAPDITPTGFNSIVLGLALGALIAVFTARN